MSASIEFGSYVISTDTSESTTDGATLFPFEVDAETTGLFVPTITSVQAEIAFFVHVTADSVDDLKTRCDAVIAAITEGTGDAVVKNGSDTVFSILMASGGYETSSGNVSPDFGETEALLTCRVVYTRFQPSAGAGSSGSVTNPDGLIGTPQFTVGRGPDGRLRVVATCNFADTDSSTARENAITWLRDFRPTQSLPDWLPGSLRLRRVDDSVTVQETGADNTVGGSAVATVTMIDIGSQLNDLSALIASATVSTTVSTVEMDERAGAAPRLITVTGTFDIKTDGSSSWDSNDSTPTVSTEILRLAINSIYDASLQRLGLARNEVQQLSGTIGMTEAGSVSFQIEGATSDSRVLSWQETTQYRVTSSATYTSNYGGGETKHVAGAGGVATVVHSLSITQLGGPPGYVRPSEVDGPDWDTIDASDTPATVKTPRSYVGSIGSEAAQYSAQFSRTYRYYNEDGGITAAGGLEALIAEVLSA